MQDSIINRAVAVVLNAVVLTACGGPASAPAPSLDIDTFKTGGFEVELTIHGIQSFVASGQYKNWASKEHERDRRLNHKITQGYYNGILLNALASDQWPLPIGSMAFNEEDYSQSGTVEGFSFGVKIAEGDAPDTWLWWQAHVDKLDQPVVFAVGHPECERCHSDGFDRILADRLPVP